MASAFLKNHMSVTNAEAGARFCEGLDEASRPACVDGLMFRTGKFGTADLRRRACAAFRDKDLAKLCRDVAAAGMYSLRKNALVASYVSG